MAPAHALASQANKKALAAFEASRFEEAAQHFTEAISHGDTTNDHQFYRNRSRCYYNLEQYEKAIDDGAKCISIKPDWLEGYARKGIAEFFFKDHNASMETYTAGLKQSPGDASMKDGIQKAKLMIDLKTAIKDHNIEVVHKTYQAMAKDKDFYSRGGTIAEVKQAWLDLADEELDRVKAKYKVTFRGVKAKLGTSGQFRCMASSPEHGLDGTPVLAIAAWAVRATGGRNVAGDAKDQFHKMLMDKKHLDQEIQGWRIAWKGKLEAYMECDEDDFSEPVTIYSIAGGPETQWERQYLLD